MRSGFTRTIASAMLLFTASPLSAAAEDGMAYVSDEELKTEIAERGEDLQRTRARLADILSQEETAAQTLAGARKQSAELELQTAARVRAFYEMSRSAGSLRFLLEAASPIEAIRRLTLLRRLLMDVLDARRAAGLYVAESEKNLSRLREDKEAAGEMLEMVTEAYESLEREAARRHLAVPKIPKRP